MESLGEKARAYLYALIVHVVVIASLFIGLLWSRAATPVATQGPIIEAEIVGAPSAPRPRAQSKPRAEPPKPVVHDRARRSGIERRACPHVVAASSAEPRAAEAGRARAGTGTAETRAAEAT